MALRVFCDSCQTFIKIAKQEDVSDLKGPVVCQACLYKVNVYLKQVERIAGESINKINSVLDNARAQFDDARHHLVDKDAKS